MGRVGMAASRPLCDPAMRGGNKPDEPPKWASAW